MRISVKTRTRPAQTIPAQLAVEAETYQSLKDAYQRFMSAGAAERKSEAGKDPIRAIFGRTAIEEDSIL